MGSPRISSRRCARGPGRVPDHQPRGPEPCQQPGLSAAAAARGRSAGTRQLPAGQPVARAAAAATDLAPSDLQAAYSLPSIGAPGQTIAVVSAYDDPTAASDLSKYLSAFKLPACTAAHGCFRKVNQSGQAAPLPPTDPTGGNWITESALGTEIARGVCQSCSILLVEANGANQADLATAVNTAARLGAQVIETSFSPPEVAGDSTTYRADYTHPGSVVVAASGDNGLNGRGHLPCRPAQRDLGRGNAAEIQFVRELRRRDGVELRRGSQWQRMQPLHARSGVAGRFR